jgi:hypothetical protein
MAAPAVLVAMPTRGYAYAPSLMRASDLARRFGCDLVLEIGRPIELVRTRIATRFLESGAEHLVTIDDDIIAPDDAIERLLAMGAPVATAPCPIAVDGRIAWNVKALDGDEWMTELPAGSFPVRHTGLGFTVIHRDVFAAMRKPWFQFGAAGDGRVIGEDTWFSNGVTKAGLSMRCDGTVCCSHFKDGLDLLQIMREPARR